MKNNRWHNLPVTKLFKSRTALALTVLLISGVTLVAIAKADQYQQQIDSLNNQNAQDQSNLSALQLQATSYQDAITILQQQIAGVQFAIATNQTKQQDIQQQIAIDQAQLAQDKTVLSDDIEAMYVNGQMTTLEMLATSKSLSSFVDAETYRNAVQDKIQSDLTSVTNLENELQQQNSQLSIVINTEKLQNDQLSSSEAQEQGMLAYDQQQQDSYNQQIQTNQQQVAVLRAEQIAANRQLVNNGGGEVIYSGTCGGSYPASAANAYGSLWGCNYPLDNTIDNWGMYNRECVSYTAWMVYKTFGYMPYWGGIGNANEWPADARAAGIATGSVPKIDSVAIYMGGATDPWGHAMWVVGIDGNMITVDQYNLYYDGNFYETNIDDSGLTYIYFGG